MENTLTITSETKFEIAGYRTVYVVVLMAPRYPVRFYDKAEAEAFASKRNRQVKEMQETIWRRA